MSKNRSTGFKKLLTEHDITFKTPNGYSKEVIDKISNRLHRNLSKSLRKYRIENSIKDQIIKDIISDLKKGEMRDLYDKIFFERLKEIGVDCKVDLISHLYKDDSITHKDYILYFITAILAEHLFDKKHQLITKRDEWLLIKERVTMYQYRMMLLFYYRISGIEVNNDILIRSIKEPRNRGYRSIRCDAIDRINTRQEKIPELADSLRDYYKNQKTQKYRSESEKKFTAIFNNCCVELGLDDKMILFKEQ